MSSNPVPPIGFITNVLFDAGLRDIGQVADFVDEHRFDCVTIGPTYQLADLETILSRGIRISDLQYCRNMLSRDADEARRYRQELEDRIEIAGSLGIPIVTISSGILEHQCSEPRRYDTFDAIRKPPIESIDEFERVYTPLVTSAEKHGVVLAVENCPLMGNWAIAPHLWEAMFERIPSASLGLTYDPGHLVWQFIDPYKPIARFADRIVHVHAKDVEILYDELNQRGILCDIAWFRFRIPGWGGVDWRRILDELWKCGYGGAIAIEHEDPLYLGSPDLVTNGLLMARRHLRAAGSGAEY